MKKAPLVPSFFKQMSLYSLVLLSLGKVSPALSQEGGPISLDCAKKTQTNFTYPQELVQQGSSVLTKISPQFHPKKQRSYIVTNELDFPLEGANMESLKCGSVLVCTQVFDPNDFAKEALSVLDFNNLQSHDDNKLIVTKAAAIINGKSPEYFGLGETFANPHFLEEANGDTVFATTKYPHIITGERTVSALGITLKKIPAVIEVESAELAAGKGSGTIPPEALKVVTGLNQSKLKGLPSKVIRTTALNPTAYSHGGQTTHQFYPIDGNNTLMVTYQLGSIKYSQLPNVPFINKVKKAKEMNQEDISGFMQRIRGYQAPKSTK